MSLYILPEQEVKGICTHQPYMLGVAVIAEISIGVVLVRIM